MRIWHYIIFLTALGCNNQPQKPEQRNSTDSIIQANKQNLSRYYITQDTILITTETDDTLRYTKAEFNNIIDNHPKLFEQHPDDPDKIYYNFADKDEFGSEAGQDNFYILYAWFLKQRNGVEKYGPQRKNIISIYSNLNSLFAHLQYGGTYFGHQRRRIPGYAEYSIYLLPKNKEGIEKTLHTLGSVFQSKDDFTNKL